MKKILAACLAVLLVLSLSVVAFAADATDVSYFKLSKAAEDITFDYNGVSQDSNRLFYKIDGIYYLYYFNSVTNDSTRSVGTYKAFKFDGVKWMTYSAANFVPGYGMSPVCLPDFVNVAYAEKNIEYNGTVLVADNVTALHRGLKDTVDSRDLSGIWQTIKPLLPVVAVAVVWFLAFRKGWSFLKGEAASA